MIELIANRTERDGTADLLKGFAVLFMIQVHLMEQFVLPDVFQSLIGKTSLFLGGPMCAPVFLAVMGYFSASSSRPTSYFLRRGLVLFVGGILLNIGRSANLLVQIILGKASLDPLFFILGADILTLAGLSLVMTGFLRVLFRKKWWLFALTALFVAAISPTLDLFEPQNREAGYAVGFLYGTAQWSYFPLFPWFSYVLAGYSLCLLVQRFPALKTMDPRNHFIYFIPLWIGIIISIPYASGITYNLNGAGGYYHHGILFFGWVILFMISYLALMKLVDIYYGNYRFALMVKWIGQKVTVLYAIQWMIIGNVASLLYKSQNLFQFAAWFVIITLLTIFMGRVFYKIKARA